MYGYGCRPDSYTVKRPQKHFDPTSFEVISYLVERGFAWDDRNLGPKRHNQN